MTQIKVNTITDAAGTGAPDVTDGVTIAGTALSEVNLFQYYAQSVEPYSEDGATETPNDGAIWWDTTFSKIWIYVDGSFKEVVYS